MGRGYVNHVDVVALHKILVFDHFRPLAHLFDLALKGAAIVIRQAVAGTMRFDSLMGYLFVLADFLHAYLLVFKVGTRPAFTVFVCGFIAFPRFVAGAVINPLILRLQVLDARLFNEKTF